MSSSNDIVIFLGPPGSGKGSLSQLCVQRLGWQQLSTGNLCREHISRRTEIGEQIDFAIKSGKLISDSLVIRMVRDWLQSSFQESGTVIFDGFPRTVAQAQALKELIDSLAPITLKLVRLTVSDADILYRLLARSICQNNACQRVYSLHKHSVLQPIKPMTCNECDSPLVRRSDDEEVAINERLQLYREHEKQLLNYFEGVGHPVYTIDAAHTLETVFEKLLATSGHD